MRILLTGTTGYVGGRLAPHLLDAGHTLVCYVRNARKLESREWYQHENVELIEGEIDDINQLQSAMDQCDAAYYLIHSMQSAASDYREHDLRLAESFAKAASQANVGRIIYLGGLGELGDALSDHLASRREVEQALRSTDVPVTVLRAAMIIGSGSASFEILRYLTERLPVMITPRWVATECQPIGIADVLKYLIACLTSDQTVGQTLDIGGPQVVNYEQLIHLTAELLDLPRRRIIPVPILSPRLSSLWIYLITPVTFRIAQPLAEGLRNRVVCRDDRAHQMMPFERLNLRDAINSAVTHTLTSQVPTGWSDAGVIRGDPDWAGGTVYEDHRSMEIAKPTQNVFDAVCIVGGGHGYYAADWLWRLRGRIDRLFGGPGLRRGRRHPQSLKYGDALDFWRVTGIDAPHHLQLRAEMKLPGQAILEFNIEELGDGGCILHQTARFKPSGLTGILYWYCVLPLHHVVFSGMLKGIKRKAMASQSTSPNIQTPHPIKSA